jgi:hypothetical protein
MKPTKALIELATRGTADERKYACSKSFALFILIYFSEFFTYKIPPFHEDFYSDCEKIIKGELVEAAWIAFRESGKTSLAKMFLVWNICYQFKHYINWDSYDRKSGEMSLFDVITWLQTNEKLIADFGHLYTERQNDNVKQLKRVSAFITSTKIKVEVFSTGMPTRGRVYMQYRPQLFILDDVENSETIRSQPVTQSIIAHIDEMRAGLATDAAVLYLGNYLSDTGVIRYVMELCARNPRGISRNIPVVLNGAIQWKDKYVMTDEEAGALNLNIENPLKYKVSLESKERDLGKQVYAVEMMNDPIKAGEMVFDRRKIDELIRYCQNPREINGGLCVWDDFNPSHRYAIGADTSEGVGRDANASVIIDFSKIPCEQIASYANPNIGPDTFGYELKREGELYGKCLIAPEQNNTGLTAITVLKTIYPVDKIYRREERDRISNVLTKKLGWRTTSQTKPEMIFKLKSAVEEGKLMIRDLRILKEMREYGISDLSDNATTRHFDLLIATAICWQMNKWAQANESQEVSYKHRPYEPASVFESSGYYQKDDELFQDNTISL